jgi:hypothetical protein
LAQVNIENVVDHLSREFRAALLSAVEEVLPEATVDDRDLLRAFKREIRRKCRTWETVPDHLVRP